MFCKICGSELNINVEYCNNCGTIATAKNLLTSALVDAIEMQNIDFEKGKNPTQDLIYSEMRKAGYKLANDDLAGAESIYENLAFAHNIPAAWLYIGIIKLIELDLTSKITVEQGLDCFKKASKLLPGAKAYYQARYSGLSIQLIGKFCNLYLEAIENAKKARNGKFLNAALMGLSAGLGNQRSNKGNSAFRGVAGVAGAAYGLHKINEHSNNLKDIESIKLVLENTIRQLIEGERIFCSDNENVHKDFIDHIRKLDQSDKLQKIIAL